MVLIVKNCYPKNQIPLTLRANVISKTNRLHNSWSHRSEANESTTAMNNQENKSTIRYGTHGFFRKIFITFWYTTILRLRVEIKISKGCGFKLGGLRLTNLTVCWDERKSKCAHICLDPVSLSTSPHQILQGAPPSQSTAGRKRNGNENSNSNSLLIVELSSEPPAWAARRVLWVCRLIGQPRKPTWCSHWKGATQKFCFDGNKSCFRLNRPTPFTAPCVIELCSLVGLQSAWVVPLTLFFVWKSTALSWSFSHVTRVPSWTHPVWGPYRWGEYWLGVVWMYTSFVSNHPSEL